MLFDGKFLAECLWAKEDPHEAVELAFSLARPQLVEWLSEYAVIEEKRRTLSRDEFRDWLLPSEEARARYHEYMENVRAKRELIKEAKTNGKSADDIRKMLTEFRRNHNTVMRVMNAPYLGPPKRIG